MKARITLAVVLATAVGLGFAECCVRLLGLAPAFKPIVLTEETTVSLSQGDRVRRSITSISPPRASAAFSQRGTIAPQVTMVILSPPRTVVADPNGTT